MDPRTFRGFCKLAYDHAGIALRENKETLVAARIAKRIRTLGLSSESEYLDYLQNDSTGEELLSFIDVISTNFTSFFREGDHFEVLKRELDARVMDGQKRVRLWCAAAATGEEPYTLAITMAEALAGSAIDWRLLATDISLRALGVAHEGCYEATKLEPVPRGLRERYFSKENAAGGAPMLRARDVLRERTVFKRLNLATPPFPMKGELDIVFCRNVMIYFDLTVRQRLIREIERLLKPGGMLVVAHSETLSGIASSFAMMKPSVYRKAA